MWQELQRTGIGIAEPTVRALVRSCRQHDELRDHFRPRQHLNETVSLSAKRHPCRTRWDAVCQMLRTV
jgi:hypothetical protein